MLVSELLEKLENIKCEAQKLSDKYKNVEYIGLEYKSLEDSWFMYVTKEVLEWVQFKGEAISVYDLYLKFDADVDINWYDESILKPSFEKGLKQIIKYPNCYPTDLKELFEDYDKYTTLYNEAYELVQDNNLYKLGFDLNVFFGKDTVYYESSRCW